MSTIIMGIRFPVLLRLLFRNGITLYPKYIIRFLVLLQSSLISSVLTLVERKNYSKKIRETEITNPPVFIIGHWRTGTTLLHQLFSLDPRFTAPTMVQTTIPDHFLFSTRYYVPILKRFLPKKRPMDNVALTPFSPQEDEFALIRMGSESPLEKLIFPSGKHFFLKDFKAYIPQGEKLETWKKNLLTLYKKITLLTGRQIVSKNPAHTMRISLLAEMFPGARFIHITRDPLTVVPSAIRLWSIMAEENGLKHRRKTPTAGEVSTTLASFLEYVSVESKRLDEKQFSEVRFEALETNPAKELRRIYSELGLQFTETFESQVTQFLSDNKNYKKNSYNLSEEEKMTILSHQVLKPD
ncbi:MAG: sulfotransferase [Bacteroidota bacterium]